MRPQITAVLALSAALASAVAAQPVGGNGGKTVMAEGHAIEFVEAGQEIVFFLIGEDGKPSETAGMTAKAFVQSAGKTETVALKGAAPNRLVGTLAAPLAAGSKLVLSTRVHGHNIQARFEK